jgi:hypothetical protein
MDLIAALRLKYACERRCTIAGSACEYISTIGMEMSQIGQQSNLTAISDRGKM